MQIKRLSENSRSRRTFLRASGGTIGAAMLASRNTAQAGEASVPPVTATIEGCSPAPLPIPGGFNARTALGPRFPDKVAHLFLPAPDAEPSTIFDFNGEVAIFNIHGTGTMTVLDPNTGIPISCRPNLPFATDVRFMRGKYTGIDGHEHQGAFAFFWMDVFETGHQFGDIDFQLQDNNPGISQGGLFWTMPIPPESANMDFEDGVAAFCLTDAQMTDMGNLLSSIWGGGALDGTGLPLPPVFPSSVSLDGRWFSPGPRQKTIDPTNRFVYDHSETKASIRWKAFRRGTMFESDSSPQQVLFAAIGLERNGKFFDDGATQD